MHMGKVVIAMPDKNIKLPIYLFKWAQKGLEEKHKTIKILYR